MTANTILILFFILIFGFTAFSTFGINKTGFIALLPYSLAGFLCAYSIMSEKSLLGFIVIYVINLINTTRLFVKTAKVTAKGGKMTLQGFGLFMPKPDVSDDAEPLIQTIKESFDGKEKSQEK